MVPEKEVSHSFRCLLDDKESLVVEGIRLTPAFYDTIPIINVKPTLKPPNAA